MHFVWYQSPEHPELSSRVGDERSKATKYNVGEFWPSAYFDGFYKAPQISDSFYQRYNDMIQEARSQNPVLEVSLDSSTTGVDSAQLRIGVHITPLDSAVDGMGSLMLVAVVYEDSAPYYSAVRGDTAYARFCARCVIGDTWGVPLKLRFGRDYDTVLATPLGDWNRSRLGAAVFVQDTSNLRVLWSVAKQRF